MLEAADDYGFAVGEAEVIYWGTCPACRSEDVGVRDTTETTPAT